MLVCLPHDHTRSHMGELLSETLACKKVLGYMIDGGWCHSASIETLVFPLFCKHFAPVDVVGKWPRPLWAEPNQIGDVTVLTGDYVLGDRNGIVIISTTTAAEVVQQTKEALSTENLVRKAILQEVEPVAAYLQHGKL